MRRAKLLQTDEALQKRHKELVQSGAVDEEAFWAAATGRRAPAAEKVIKAPSNELLVDAPRGESTGRTVTFSLSPEKIAFVFSMYPAVRRAHAAHVPKVCFGVRIVASSTAWRRRSCGRYLAPMAWGGVVSSPPTHTRRHARPRHRGRASSAPQRLRSLAARIASTPGRSAHGPKHATSSHEHTHTRVAGRHRRDRTDTQITRARTCPRPSSGSSTSSRATSGATRVGPSSRRARPKPMLLMICSLDMRSREMMLCRSRPRCGKLWIYRGRTRIDSCLQR